MENKEVNDKIKLNYEEMDKVSGGSNLDLEKELKKVENPRRKGK